MGLTPELVQRIRSLPPEKQQEFAGLLAEFETASGRELCRTKFIPFVEKVWPGFISGRHHRIMAEKFEAIANGTLKRLIICMPPRHTKSEFGSFHLPAWFLGQFPGKKVIQASHTAELSVGFGRKVRNLVDTDQYKDIFPELELRSDSKAAGRWDTSNGGSYFAIGIGGAVTGKGADLLIIDDPHDEQEGQSGDPAVFDHAYEWYTSGPRQRLQPGGAIVIIATRWSKRDLIGQVLKASSMRQGVDEWEVIEFPAIMPSGNPLWPEFWPIEELEAIKAEIPIHKWEAQYQQNPVSEGAALVKREWWKLWEQKEAPPCQYLIQSWDTAFLKTQRADYSACTTWGVFYHPDDNGNMQANIILLDAHREKMEFPTLKKRALEMYNYWQPDNVLIEAKAAGTPLIFELRAMGIAVTDFTPSRGNDKIARVNAVADMFSSGRIWIPQTRFAEEVVEEFASFPSGEHDDYVDSSTQALMRFRRGGFVSLQSDAMDEPIYRRKKEYY
jgi:predicted phage terminase large subunit-like protein